MEIIVGGQNREYSTYMLNRMTKQPKNPESTFSNSDL